jgi:drug/metabolite transporter (DMT)-like permease
VLDHLFAAQEVDKWTESGTFKRKQVIEHWRQRGLALVGGGLASAGAYGLVIFAMNSNPMAMVSALRETSVLMAALIGTLVLKEGFGKTRVSAAVLVTGGVFIMNLGA